MVKEEAGLSLYVRMGSQALNNPSMCLVPPRFLLLYSRSSPSTIVARRQSRKLGRCTG